MKTRGNNKDSFLLNISPLKGDNPTKRYKGLLGMKANVKTVITEKDNKRGFKKTKDVNWFRI